MLRYLPPQEVHGFFPNFWSRTMAFTWGSTTHQDMTEEAILNITVRLFAEMPPSIKGKRFREEDFKDKTLLADDIFAAFYGPKVSAKRFRGAIAQVANANAAMDFDNTTRDDPVLHFDSELIFSSNAWLLQTRKEILQAVHSEQYSIARDKLGQLLHSLQDFYSHSNWVELGNQQIHPDLVQPGHEIKSIAEAGIPTCSDCTDWTCEGNLLEDVASKGLLTTGYYGSQPQKPIGSVSPPPLHCILYFLVHQLLDISPATGLSFVVDTTGSMGDEINAAKYQARDIIDQRRGTPQEPDFYILVPFHDPGELALQYSPPYSEIFVFTDASAKDAHLKNSVESLSQEKKCKVTFLITEDPSRTRARRETLAPDRFDLYVKLAHSSGGQIIFTDDKNIRQVAKIISESSISSVTLFRHQKGNIFSLKGAHQKIKKRATELEVHQFWIDSQSTLDFLYYFAVPVDGRHPGLFMMDNHPIEGLPTYLVIMAMGLNQSGSVHLQAVNLEGRTGSLGELELQGGAKRADLFVAELPPTLLTSSNFSIVLSRDTPVFPGRPVSITWKVMNPGSSKEYELKVSSVPKFAANISSSRLQLGFNQTATGQISLHVPNTTAAGSVITVTLQANLLHSDGDPGFAHIYLLVMPLPMMQIFPSPLCSIASADGSCGPPHSLCHSQHWTVILRIRDEAGIRSVQVEGGAVVPHQADGPAELVTYTSDCCSRQAQLVVTNLLGEKYQCQVAAPPSTLPGKAVPRPSDVKARVGPPPTIAWWCWALLTVFLTIDWLGF
ncbi:hypothetical protein JD844_013469 [Phrynosoma platyrhinos]|uniref:von Willebrand factor A domain containing 7 n=1 Tax=Phrynosoma platyrhinos TaxID=52577 RepID=A0ABQ7TLY6_PHRPL|nr:hypothetical protein JD844_013469 [Phrynosoma platyrhinos]